MRGEKIKFSSFPLGRLGGRAGSGSVPSRHLVGGHGDMETCRHVGTHGTVMKCTKSLIVIIVVVRIVRIVRIVFILAPVSRSRITYNVHGVLASLLPYTALHSTAQHSTAQSRY